MSKSATTAVIIVDDVCRFALYAWRYLSRTVGFGIGAVSDDGRPPESLREISEEENRNIYFRSETGEIRPLSSPGREYEIWWIDTRGAFTEDLRAVLSRTRRQPRRFFVDLRGPYNTQEVSKGGGRRGVDLVLDILELNRIKCDSDSDRDQVRLVSSYQTAPHSYRTFSRNETKLLRVHPKSPETLEILWKGEKKASRADAPMNVLVTGAGFEFCDDAVLNLGTRRTGKVLMDMFPEAREYKGHYGYAYPREYHEARDNFSVRLRDTARQENLDAYWNDLLLAELSREVKSKSEGDDKIKASEREYRRREAFRKEFLNDDWGFLDQALDALKVDGLVGWLTTNYTRFVDRALAIYAVGQRAAKNPRDKQDYGAWKTVASSNEAQHLLRKLVQAPDEWSGDGGPYLFKLHGDISNLLTMALAGHDKEFFSPLSLPIDSLHAVYTAAEEFLIHRLGPSDKSVVWHIVGHGLKDRLLVQLVDKVRKATQPERHHFMVVDKYAHPDRILKKKIKSNDSVHLVCAGARAYMARLALRGLLPTELNDPEELKKWVEDMHD